MRLLFTFAGNVGHLNPLIPIARAAEAAAHPVAFACRPWMLSKVEALGFTAFPSGTDRGLIPRRAPLARVDSEREIEEFAIGFGGRIARDRARDLLPLCEEWRPDMLVCEETDFGPMVIAERLGLRYATVLVIASGSLVRPDRVSGTLNEVRANYGLPPDPALEMPGRYLVLSPFPRGLRDPGYPLPPTAHFYRPFPRTVVAREQAPAWRGHLPDAPAVYFTLGTVFPLESGDLFARVLAGLRDLPINLLVTVGPDIDPVEFGPQPANVTLAGYVPQSSILPHCDLVVSHGGSGSVLGALAHALPMVLIPMGADQPLNAARCLELGVARILDADSATPAKVADVVLDVLHGPSYRLAAQAIRDEIEAMPGPAAAIALLERLGQEKRPLVSTSTVP